MLTTRERVREYYATHIGATRAEAARALGINVIALRAHVIALRAEWSSVRDHVPGQCKVLKALNELHDEYERSQKRA